MERVLDHHLRDIVSLAELAAYLERAAEEPELLAGAAARAGMGRILLQERPAEGEALLRRSFEQGDQRAGKLLALACRRGGRYGELQEVLEEMWARRRGLFQGEALAKLYEHRRGEPQRALALVREMLEGMPYLSEPARRALRHRRKRLEGKLVGRSGGES
jgi:hypothetical protein